MRLRLFFLVFSSFASLSAAHGETVYATLAGNLAAPTETNGSVVFFTTSPATFAQRFTTATLPAIGDGDQSGFVMYRFNWSLLPAQGNYDPVQEGFPDLNTTYAVDLRADAGGAPGASLLSSPATAAMSSPGIVTFGYADLAIEPTVSLQSNTSYWLTVAFQSAEDAIGTQLMMPFTTGLQQTGPGAVDNLMVTTTGSAWSGLSERAVMQVQVETVPEPSTIALVAAGAAILGWRMRRTGRLFPVG